MNIDQAKALRLEEILAAQGFAPVRVSKGGSELWYLSPFREERTPSFSVDTRLNVWCDFGETGDHKQKCTGGKSIDYAMRFYNCEVKDALRHLSNLVGSNTVSATEPPKARSKKNPLTLQEIKPIAHPALLIFLVERKIPLALAERYLHQIHYKHEKTGNTGFALGMRNNSNGYEIRNRYFKGLIGKRDISFIQGSHPNGNIQIIEGHYDFLSLLSIYRKEVPQSDVIILNGATMINEAAYIIRDGSYENIQTWFDNDRGGQQAFKKLSDEFKDAALSIRSQNHRYHGFNDVNDMHRNLPNQELYQRFGLS